MTQIANAPGDLQNMDAVTAVLADARMLIEPTQRAVIARLPAQVRHVAGFHLGWWDADGNEIPRSGGKGVRPALTIACARAAGGSARAAVDAAVVVELVHDFSLIHDDIMDGDAMRRHRRTAWAAFGVPRALLTGDALLVLAFDLVESGTSNEALRAAVLELCAGQSNDLAFVDRTDVSLPECLRMAEQKTATLLGSACQLGALSATDDIRIAGLYRQFGRELGISFQLIDDILGIWGEEAVTGKPIYSDLKSRKKSLPVVAALSSNSAAGRELATLYGRAGELHDHELAYAAELIERAGGRAWAEDEAERYRFSALDTLAAAEPDPNAAADLLALADLITFRSA